MIGWRRFARWLLGRWVFFAGWVGNDLSRRFATPPDTHPVPHVGWRHGYLQAGAEASMAADEDARFRRFLRSYEMPVEERR